MSNIHWLERKGAMKNLVGHINKPRIDAHTILKLIELRNSMRGVKRSLYEESLISEEKNEQVL